MASESVINMSGEHIDSEFRASSTIVVTEATKCTRMVAPASDSRQQEKLDALIDAISNKAAATQGGCTAERAKLAVLSAIAQMKSRT